MTAPMVKAKGVTAEVPVADADRRAAPRVLVDLEVDYASEENYLFAYITDISETGIFVRTTTPEQPGTLLNLRQGHLGQSLPAGRSRQFAPGHGSPFRRIG